jgi:ferric-dicitrate binding protein FerR (iron transport regulator)
MSLTWQQLAELDSLLSDLADVRLSAERRLALEGLLQAESEARDHYIRFMALGSDLHEFGATSLSVDDDELSVESSLRDADAGLGETGPRGRVSPRRDTARGASGRWWPAWTAAGILVLAITLLATWWPPRPDTSPPPAAGPIVGRLENVAGLVEVAVGEGSATQAVEKGSVHSGQTIVTKGKEAQAAIRLEDGTLILVAGDTRVAFSPEERDRIDIELGNATAAVRPRPADRPLVFCTPEARIEVLGTRLSVARAERRTRVDVLEGDIRLTRLSDQRSVTLAGGQTADVSPQADLRPAPIQPAPDTWSLDFNDGLPPGWETGQLVFHDLPEGSRAAARTAAVEENGQRRHQLRSHNAWSKGLFTLHDDSWIHIRYRLEKPGTFLLYVVCRQYDFGEPVATLLTPGNLRQTEPNRWHTLTLPLNQFRRARAQDIVPLNGQLVAFCLAFDSPEHNPGLTVDRVWITRGMPAEPRLPGEEDSSPVDGTP